MKRCFRYLLAAIAITSGTHADEAGVAAIMKKWDSDLTEWKAAYETASPEMRKDLLKTQPNAERFAKPLWAQLKPVVKSPACLPGVVWMMNHVPAVAATHDPKESKDIVANLLDAIEIDLIAEPGIGATAYTLGNSSDLRCREILERMREINPNVKDQGLAAMALAMSIKEKHGLMRDDPRLNNVRLQYIKEAIQKSFDEPFGGARVSDYCQMYLYEINNLSIKRKAPAFQAAMSDGSRVKMPSGKPTLLVFCLPADNASMSLVEQSDILKTKFPGLEVLPVCPLGEEAAKKDMILSQLDTPVMLDEKSDVFKLYRVSSVPFVYLLDKDGIVRLRGVPDVVFEQSLAQALTVPVEEDKAIVQGRTAQSSTQTSEQPRREQPRIRETPDPAAQAPGTGRAGQFTPPELRPMPE